MNLKTKCVHIWAKYKEYLTTFSLMLGLIFVLSQLFPSYWAFLTSFFNRWIEESREIDFTENEYSYKEDFFKSTLRYSEVNNKEDIKVFYHNKDIVAQLSIGNEKSNIYNLIYNTHFNNYEIIPSSNYLIGLCNSNASYGPIPIDIKVLNNIKEKALLLNRIIIQVSRSKIDPISYITMQNYLDNDDIKIISLNNSKQNYVENVKFSYSIVDTNIHSVDNHNYNRNFEKIYKSADFQLEDDNPKHKAKRNDCYSILRVIGQLKYKTTGINNNKYIANVPIDRIFEFTRYRNFGSQVLKDTTYNFDLDQHSNFNRKKYLLVQNISDIVKPNDVTYFGIKFNSSMQARYNIDIIVLFNNDQQIVFPNINLNIVPY